MPKAKLDECINLLTSSAVGKATPSAAAGRPAQARAPSYVPGLFKSPGQIQIPRGDFLRFLGELEKISDAYIPFNVRAGAFLVKTLYMFACAADMSQKTDRGLEEEKRSGFFEWIKIL